MDPFEAIGLASSILQFLEIGTKIVEDVHQSRHDMAAGDETLESFIKTLELMSSQLSTPRTNIAVAPEEDLLRKTASECQLLTEEMFGLLSTLKTRNPKSKFESITIAWKIFRKTSYKTALEVKLD